MASANSSLIPVFESTINQQVVQTVDAREIHAFLESKRQFSNWITYQIEAFDFKQDVDFSTINNSDYSPPRKEYHVSLDMAKELAMVERNAKGKEARQYFIAIEKEYQKQQEAMTPAEFLVRQAQMMLDHERRVAAQERINQETKLINTDNSTVSKTCKICGKEKIISDFPKNKICKGGYTNQCKECCASRINKEKKAEYDKNFKAANKEKILSSQKDYREKHKERRSELNKSWYEDHKEQRHDYNKVWRENNKALHRSLSNSWREKNKEHYDICQKNWRLAHPDIAALHRRNRKSRKIGAVGAHTVSDIHNLLNLQRNKCAVCNILLEKGYHIDHIVSLANGGSNDKYNLQILCAPCNLSKHAKDPIKFMQSKGNLL